MAEKTDSFSSNDNAPLMELDITFPHPSPNARPLLPTPASDADGVGLRNAGNVPGTSIELDDKVSWESGVDAADRLDYLIAVSSGVISGLVDVLWVGDFSLDRASTWGKDQIDRFVVKVAHREGYKGDGLAGAIRKLEEDHPFAADGSADAFGGGLQHHLRDFSHHFGIDGLFFSLFTQFTGLVVGTDRLGNLMAIPVETSRRSFIGKNFHEKIAFGIIGWFFHMVSDMAGSSESLTGGTGIPGPILSLLKDASALPFFRETNSDEPGFRLWISRLFNGTLLANRDANGHIIKGTERRFDLRTEIGVLEEAGRQAVPVLANQCIIRGFYFCRRVIAEIRDLNICCIDELGCIAPEDVLPWGTPAVRRMVTISSGIFTGIDLADAAVHAMKSRDCISFFLRVNYVGIATFTIACAEDVHATIEDKKAHGGESSEEACERRLSNLRCLELDSLQTRILHSIEYALVTYDINQEQHTKRAERKRKWLQEWSSQVDESSCSSGLGYFMADDAIYAAIASRLDEDDSSWLWLVAMEASLFRPYQPLSKDKDECYKGLRLCSDYMSDTFCTHQDLIGARELKDLNAAVDRTRSQLDGSKTKLIAGVAGTATAIAATGGLAAALAPAVAPALAASLGFEAAALHGAALTSASLAFLGGGSIAVGGAGIAGGTMFITGGGALLGAAGGAGVTAVASMALSTGGGYVIEECAKLETFCRSVLLDRYGNIASATAIHSALNCRIVELETAQERVRQAAFSGMKSSKDNSGADVSPQEALKIIGKTIRIMSRCRDALTKAIGDARAESPTLQA